MKANSKFHYGLLAMLEIAMHEGENGLLQKEIAEKRDIPLKYLDQVLRALKTTGLIDRKKSRSSGFLITRKADLISIYDIYRSFDPELCMLFCVSNPDLCKKKGKCATHEFFCGLSETIQSYMKNTSLADLIKREKETLSLF